MLHNMNKLRYIFGYFNKKGLRTRFWCNALHCLDGNKFLSNRKKKFFWVVHTKVLMHKLNCFKIFIYLFTVLSFNFDCFVISDLEYKFK